MSYHSFAAGYARYGRTIAIHAAKTYGVPLETCLAYVRRYAVQGYDLAYVV